MWSGGTYSWLLTRISTRRFSRDRAAVCVKKAWFVVNGQVVFSWLYTLVRQLSPFLPRLAVSDKRFSEVMVVEKKIKMRVTARHQNKWIWKLFRTIEEILKKNILRRVCWRRLMNFAKKMSGDLCVLPYILSIQNVKYKY